MSLLTQFTQQELDALDKAFELAVRCNDTGGGSTMAKMLLGLYNGYRFPFVLTDLRRLDGGNLNVALQVMRMDASRCRAEVHEIIAEIFGTEPNVIGNVFEHWAHDYRLKCRCKKEYLQPQLRFDFKKAA